MGPQNGALGNYGGHWRSVAPPMSGGGTPLQAKLEGSEDLRRRSEAAEMRSTKSPGSDTPLGRRIILSIYYIMLRIYSISITRKPPHGCRNQNRFGDQAGKCAGEPLCMRACVHACVRACVRGRVGVGVGVEDHQSIWSHGRIEDT